MEKIRSVEVLLQRIVKRDFVIDEQAAIRLLDTPVGFAKEVADLGPRADALSQERKTIRNRWVRRQLGEIAWRRGQHSRAVEAKCDHVNPKPWVPNVAAVGRWRICVAHLQSKGAALFEDIEAVFRAGRNVPRIVAKRRGAGRQCDDEACQAEGAEEIHAEL
jgi:hypothetical protein